jgi:parvulin-like peptidyl-prolyl isomerase
VVDGPGYGICIDQEQRSGNVVRCDNVPVSAGRGLANVSCFAQVTAARRTAHKERLILGLCRLRRRGKYFQRVVRTSVRHIFILCIAATALLGVAGCGGSDGVPGNAVAVVGDQTVTKDELDRLLAQARANAKESRRPFPKEGTPQHRQLRDQFIQNLVRRAQLAAAAEDRDIEISDEKIEQRRKLLVDQYYGGSEKRYREALAKEGVSEEQARADLETSLIQQELFKEVGNDVKVSDAEVRKHYEKNKRSYASPARREIRQILVGTDQRGLAQRLANQLRSGANFAQLARRYSRDPRGKTSGGRLELAKGDADMALERVVFSAPRGTIAGPVRTRFGWHVVEALGPVQRGKTWAYAQVKEQIRQELLQKKKSDAASNYLVQIARKTDVDYRAGYAPSA